jgi:hypothetical protein
LVMSSYAAAGDVRAGSFVTGEVSGKEMERRGKLEG